MITLNLKYFRDNEKVKLEQTACVRKIEMPSVIEKFSLIEDNSTTRTSFFIEEEKLDDLINFLNNFKYKKVKKDNRRF